MTKKCSVGLTCLIKKTRLYSGHSCRPNFQERREGEIIQVTLRCHLQNDFALRQGMMSAIFEVLLIMEGKVTWQYP